MIFQSLFRKKDKIKKHRVPTNRLHLAILSKYRNSRKKKVNNDNNIE
jgi:hypothetical protein